MGISESQEAIFERLFDQAEIAAFNKKELHDYRESQKDFWDLNSVIETAEKKGIEKGRAEGIKKGRAEGQVSIAMSLKQMGVLSVSQIAEATGLTEDEISEL